MENRYINRKVVRLQNCDYATANAYFITICTQDKACLLGSIHKLSGLGQIAKQELEELRPTIRKCLWKNM